MPAAVTGDAVRVLGIAGSLRRASFNRAALAAAVELAPAGMAIEVADLAPIPLYDNDVYEQGFPAPVAALRARVQAADALLFVTPEYNHSIPGVLKNAIDWVSRPPDQPFAGKPYAVVGVSPGGFGTARAQLHLRQVAAALDLLALNRPQVLIAQAAQKFDAALRLSDEAARQQIGALLAALLAWTERLRAG